MEKNIINKIMSFSDLFNADNKIINLMYEIGLICDANNEKMSIIDKPFEIFWGSPDEPRHSKLLSYFINPKEDHNFGEVLLKSFLKHIGLEDLSNDGEFEVFPEFHIEGGQIDILIKYNKDNGKKYAVIVENKVKGVKDGPGQLEKYFNAIKRMDYDDNQIYIIYLPLRNDKQPSKESLGKLAKDKVKIKTFKENIIEWLNENIDEDDKQLNREMHGDEMCDNLRHYRDLINFLLKSEEVKKMQNDIFNKLRENKSLEFQWEDIEKMSSYIDELKKEFLIYKRAELLINLKNKLIKDNKKNIEIFCLINDNKKEEKIETLNIYQINDIKESNFWINPYVTIYLSVNPFCSVALCVSDWGELRIGLCRAPNINFISGLEEIVNKYKSTFNDYSDGGTGKDWYFLRIIKKPNEWLNIDGKEYINEIEKLYNDINNILDIKNFKK